MPFKMKFCVVAILVLISNILNAQSRASAEFFVRIKDSGKFQISVNNDYCYSSSGLYRFFELLPGKATIVITYPGKVYSKGIILTDGVRSIAVFSKADGLKIIQELDIYHESIYSLDNWNTPTQTISRKPTDRQRTNNHNREMPLEDFTPLMESYNKISHDDERINFLTMTLRDNRVSVEQLMLLLKKVAFDDARLSAAINNYNNVFDREKFYLIRDLFAFPLSKEKLDLFLTKQDY